MSNIPPELGAFAESEGAAGFQDWLATQGAGGFYNPNVSPEVWRGYRKAKTPQRDIVGNADGPILTTPDEDDISTADEMVSEFFSWSDSELRSFQEKAFQAGLYGNATRRDIRFGDYDEDTLQIWEQVVNRSAGFFSQGRKVSPFQVLDKAVQAAKDAGLDPDTREQETIALTNPADLAAVFNNVAQQTIGKKLDPTQLQAMVSAYQATESSVQSQAAGMSESGGTLTKPPDPSTFAQNQIAQDDPVAATSHAAAKAFEGVLKLIGASGYGG